MYEIFAKLLAERGLKPADITRETGINSTVFSEWKKGKSKPNTEKLIKIANFLNVSVEYLSGNSKVIRCPKCGIEYDESDTEDIAYHKQEHLKWEAATKKFGVLYCNSTENERIKAKNRTRLVDNTLTFEERYQAQLEVFRCLFSRSVNANGFSLEHVSFDEYVAMMLGNDSYRKNISDDLYNVLVEKYGIKSGINFGSIYYIPKKSTTLSKKDNRDIAKDIDSIMYKLTSEEYGPAAYNGENLSKESTDLFKEELEIALKRLKLINKEKYNPNKNKK